MPAELDAESTTAELIARARIRSRKTQAQLAALVGVKRITVARWEHGSHLPGDGSVLRLAAVLGLREAALQEAVDRERWQRREERLEEGA
jgi:transcriptional regulator with XRE-family HTH domain